MFLPARRIDKFLDRHSGRSFEPVHDQAELAARASRRIRCLSAGCCALLLRTGRAGAFCSGLAWSWGGPPSPAAPLARPPTTPSPVGIMNPGPGGWRAGPVPFLDLTTVPLPGARKSTTKSSFGAGSSEPEGLKTLRKNQSGTQSIPLVLIPPPPPLLLGQRRHHYMVASSWLNSGVLRGYTREFPGTETRLSAL